MSVAAAQASQQISQGRTISEKEAREIALKAVPGEVMDVAIEKKLGAKKFVVEVIAEADGAETDVIIDMETGKVLATEKWLFAFCAEGAQGSGLQHCVPTSAPSYFPLPLQ